MSVGSWSIDDSGQIRVDNQGVATTYLKLVIIMTSLDDNLTAIQVGLPQFQRFQPHPNAVSSRRFSGESLTTVGTETALYVSEFQADQVKGTTVWHATVTYTDSIINNPLNVAAVIGEVQTYTIPGATSVDYQGQAILNTAGEPPEPFDFPERVMKIPIIRNIAADIPDWLWDWEDCVNADVVQFGSRACPPKTLMISSITVGAIQVESGVSYRVCTIEVLMRKSTWEAVFPSRGFNQLVTEKEVVSVPTSGSVSFSTVKRLSPILVKGEVPNEAQFLDLNGKWIPNPQPTDVVLLTALLQKPVPFSQFPLT